MEPKVNPFRGEYGRRYLKALFFETTLADKSTVVYTLKDHDHEGYPSLYRLYMEMKDPTEYLFANKYLDGWSHWQELCECSWFQPYLSRWRLELELYIKAKALVKLLEEAEHPEGKNYFNVNKYLLERGWKDKDTPGRGRPSKQQVKDAALELAKEQERIDTDADRILIN